MGHFAIAFVGRVGSSFLQALIDSHPDATCFGEVMVHPSPCVTKADVTARLDETVHSTSSAVAGFKLPFCSVPLPDGVLEVLAARNYSFVHVQRRNKFDQYLSMRLAQVNNAWRSDMGTYAVDRIDVDPRDAIDHIRAFHSFDRSIEEMLAREFPFHQVFYEDVVSGEALPGVLDFLALERRSLTSVFGRQRSRTQRDTISNYRDVAVALEGSGLGHFLEGDPRAPGLIRSIVDRLRSASLKS